MIVTLIKIVSILSIVASAFCAVIGLYNIGINISSRNKLKEKSRQLARSERKKASNILRLHAECGALHEKIKKAHERTKKIGQTFLILLLFAFSFKLILIFL